MKKTFISIIIALMATIMSCAQQRTTENLLEEGKFKLYQTENIWTFLKLDTTNGKVWQLQYSINNDNAGEVIVNKDELNFDGAVKKGRFEMYPTKNMYNFLLLDRETGAVYQIQWSMEAANRGLANVISQ